MSKTYGKNLDYPAIITATLDPTVFGGPVKDLETRVRQYDHSLVNYICNTRLNPIVYIENSGYPLDREKYRSLAEKHGKRIEFIRGSQPVEETKMYGKGYGDALLVQEALEQSRELRTQEFFYKLSGRLYIENIDKVIRSCGKHRNEFISYDGIGWVMTWIFRMNIEDYWRVMKDVHLQCNEKKLRDMEICYWLRLIHADIDVGCFHTYPKMFGNIGETDQPYMDSGFEYILRNIGTRLGVFKMRSFSGKVFWKVFMLLTHRRPYVTVNDQ